MLFDKKFFDNIVLLTQGKFCEPSVIFSLLQRDGRFIDFLMEDISEYTDAQVGSVARTVQQGCKKTLKDYAEFESIIDQEENSEVKVEKGYNPNSMILSGNVSGEPPFRGILIHHGWKLKKAEFPWPLDDDFFEVAQNPVDWKYQVYVKCCDEYKNFKRYALLYGLEFNRAKYKL